MSKHNRNNDRNAFQNQRPAMSPQISESTLDSALQAASTVTDVSGSPQKLPPETILGSDDGTVDPKVAELLKTIEGMKAGYATKNKMLAWLVEERLMHVLAAFLYAMTDICSASEMNQIIDYLKARKPHEYDAGLIESYRIQMVEIAEARANQVIVKAESLAEMLETA